MEMVPMKIIWKKSQANDLKEFHKINIIQIQQFTFRDIYVYSYKHTHTITIRRGKGHAFEGKMKRAYGMV